VWRALDQLGAMVEVPDEPVPDLPQRPVAADPQVAELDAEARGPGAGARIPQGRFSVSESLVRAVAPLVIEIDCVMGWTTSSEGESW
jgi:hypothetical protein